MRAIGEHELRFRVRPLGRLSLVPRASTAVYYDVPGGSLALAGITLLLRTEGGRSVWQLKLPAEVARLELEDEGGPEEPPPSLVMLLQAHLRHGPLEPI